MFNSNKNKNLKVVVHPSSDKVDLDDRSNKPNKSSDELDKDHFTISHLDDGTDGTVLDKHRSTRSTTTTAKSYELQIEEEEEENNATRSINNAFYYFLDQDALLFYLEKFYLIEESVTNISK